VALLKNQIENMPNIASERTVADLKDLAMNNNENRTEITNAGGIPLLVRILSEENNFDERTHEYAAGALRELADTHDTHEAIVQAGAIPTLVTMLKRNSESLKVYAAEALMGLTKNVNNKQHLSDADVIPLLKEMLHSTNTALNKCATTALDNLEQQDNGPPSKE